MRRCGWSNNKTNMHIVIAPDSFKDSLRAVKAAKHIKNGIEKIFPKAEFTLIPMADGGEGTVDALVQNRGGIYQNCSTTDPLGRSITARYGIVKDKKLAIIEMAAASGLELLTTKERNPLKTTSYGTGILIKDALDKGCQNLIIGLGGSATVDAGLGAMEALGMQFFDHNNKPVKTNGQTLANIYRYDSSQLDPRLQKTTIQFASDVTNPLNGNQGAASVFAPQKGADNKSTERLKKNLEHISTIIHSEQNPALDKDEGTGAAGGFAFPFLALMERTSIKSGFSIIAAHVNLEETIKKADFVITGEGKIDDQTGFGKTPVGIAQLAKKWQKPCYAFAGTCGERLDNLYETGLSAIIPLSHKPQSLDEAIKNADKNLERSAEMLARIVYSIYKHTNT